jgi:AraC family transcriptional regulator, dual regulator of chb operon
MLKLEARSIFAPGIGTHYACRTADDAIHTPLHYHDFFEIFLIVHRINGMDVRLTVGTLVFMRPDDHHAYTPITGTHCQFINLAFLDAALQETLHYVRAGTSIPQLCAPAMPNMIRLPLAQQQALLGRLEGLHRPEQQPRLQAVARALLAELLVDYVLFPPQAAQPAELPAWLAEVCTQMAQPAYFIEGRPALLRLAQRSEEHIARSFRTWLDTTPSAFINALRLDHVCRQLTHTDKPIIELVYDAGFDNLSHFYHLFRARFQVSPNQFRRQGVIKQSNRDASGQRDTAPHTKIVP